MDNLLDIKGLTKKYEGITVLDDISLSLPSGRIVGLLGQNGAGKTTLIKILAGLISDYQGSIRINGEPLGIRTKSLISYLPDKTYFSPWMRVQDTIDIFSDFYKDFDLAKAKELLSSLGIRLEDKVSKLSKGNYEKVQLVAVMSRNAKIYLLDEPLGGIDPASRSIVIDTIISNYNEDSLVLISTQLISDVERVFDSVVILKDKKIFLNEDVDTIREKYGKSIDEMFREVFKCC